MRKLVIFGLLLASCLIFQSCAGCSDTQASYIAMMDTTEFHNDFKQPIVDNGPVTGAKNVVRMKKENGIYKIPVTLNGVEMDFYFDTGAGMISISEIEAAFLLKQGKITQQDMLGNQNFENALGEKHRTAIVNIKDVTIAGRTIHNVEASIVPNSGAPLLLGQSLLSKFGKISIDYDNSQIVFE